MNKYRAKAKDSFNTRLRFFKFHCALNNASFNKEKFLAYELSNNKNIIDVYTCQYYQWEGDEYLDYIGCDLKIKEIYSKMESLRLSEDEVADWFEDYFKRFKSQYHIDVFRKHAESEKCSYCGITLSQIEKLASSKQLYKKNERGFAMEIDHRKPNLEYSDDNCTPACYWCNNAKTDEFDDIEFKPIGELIGKTLRNRLKS